ncbi:MAG TPA: ATP synthase F0 subunit C [Candidatus Hydrogenedentes bacterium]|nr:ATP synthase F0 subunit C [Candidatus Hydrogenedentota bacterium]
MEISAETWELIGRYVGAGLALGFGGIGAAIGMGMAAGKANEGIMRQPACQGAMLRTMLIGQAVGGSPSIFALVIGIVILFVKMPLSGLTLAAGAVGAGLSIGLGCLGSGLGCGWPAGAACDGLARNPGQSGKLTQIMIIGQAVGQTPSIFATVIALVLLYVPAALNVHTGWVVAGVAVGAGFAMGAGALGPGMGSGLAAGGAVRGIGCWPKSYGVTLRTMLIGQAVGQTPAIFGMLLAFIMLFALGGRAVGLVGFAKTLGAGLAVGFGSVGPGIGCGHAADSGAEWTARQPLHGAALLRTLLIGQAVAQSTAIYSLVIALVLLYGAG